MSIRSLVASRLARSGHALPAAAAISQAPRARHAASPLLSSFGPATRAFSSRPLWKGVPAENQQEQGESERQEDLVPQVFDPAGVHRLLRAHLQRQDPRPLQDHRRQGRP